jgi:tetratricopeptide (TPR) repeat protein
MSLVSKYRSNSSLSYNEPQIQIDSLATLESIKRRQGYMIAAQVATISAIANQTKETVDAIELVNDTLVSIESTIQNGFDSIENSIQRLETNLLENLNEIKWYLFNVDQKLDELINLVRFSGATKSAEYNKQGFILYKIGSYNESIEQFNKSLNENPINVESYINLGFVYLRLEQLDDSILYFEKAQTFVKEDFSYYEEISKERVEKTEVFILDSLSTLYTLKSEYDKSILCLEMILNSNIDEETKILSKYKLARILCVKGDHEKSLSHLEDLINQQHFEPVSMAVVSEEFLPIRHDILNYIQNKLITVKQIFLSNIDIYHNKLLGVITDEDLESKCVELLLMLKSGINTGGDYKILLTDNFKHSVGDFLDLIALLGELLEKISNNKNIIENQSQKLLELDQQTRADLTNVDYGDNLEDVSFKLYIEKLNKSIHSGIEDKMSQFKEAFKLIDDLAKSTLAIVDEIKLKIEDGLLSYLLLDFSCVELHSSLIKNLKKFDTDSEEGKVDTVSDVIGKDLHKLLEKFGDRFEIEGNSSDYSIFEKFKKRALDVSDIMNISYEDAMGLLKTPDDFVSRVKNLSATKQRQIAELFNSEK